MEGTAPDTGGTYDKSGNKWCYYNCTDQSTGQTKDIFAPGHGQFCIGMQGGDQFDEVTYDTFTHDTNSWWDRAPLGPFTNGPDFDKALRNNFDCQPTPPPPPNCPNPK